MANRNPIIDGHRSQRAPSTIHKRRRIVAAWRAWCAANHVQPIPARAAAVRRWCRERAAHVSVPAMRNELSALRGWHRDEGATFPEPSRFAELFARLDALVRIAARPDSTTLVRVADAIGDDMHATHERALIRFFAHSERRVDELADVRLADLVRGDDGNLRARGRPGTVADADRDLDPATTAAIRAWLLVRPDSSRLFCKLDGATLTTADVLAILRDRAADAGESLAPPDVSRPLRAKRSWRTLDELLAAGPVEEVAS